MASQATDNRGQPDVGYNLQRNEYLVTVDDYSKVDEDVYGVRLTAGGIVLVAATLLLANLIASRARLP